MDPKQMPINVVNAELQAEDSEESQWSLSSLQQLKGLTLNDMRFEEENHAAHQKVKTETQKQIKVEYPPKQVILESTNLFLVGKIIQQVGQLFILQATSPQNIVDLNNCVFNEERKCWGFVIDVLGRVDQPYYAIKLFPEQMKNADSSLINKNIYYAQGCKTLTEEDIKSIEGKKNIDFEDDDSNSSSNGQQFSEQPFRKQTYKSRHHRRNSYQERPQYRERTRQNKQRRYEHFNENRFNRPPQMQMPGNNQEYLQNMYSMYYQQMMQMQGTQPGNHQMPLPPFFYPMPPK